MTRTLPAAEVRQQLDKLLDQTQSGGDSILIERNGKAAAALVPVEVYEKAMEGRRRFADAVADFRKHVRQDVPPEELERIIDREVEIVRAERFAKESQDPAPENENGKT